MNNVSFVGRLTKDAEVRVTLSGKQVAQFGLAVDRPFTYGENKQTDFFNMVWWVKSTAATDYLTKGREVAVTGYIQNRSFEGKDGQKRYITEVIVNTLGFVGGSKKQEQPALTTGEAVADDSKIPF